MTAEIFDRPAGAGGDVRVASVVFTLGCAACEPAPMLTTPAEPGRLTMSVEPPATPLDEVPPDDVLPHVEAGDEASAHLLTPLAPGVDG